MNELVIQNVVKLFLSYGLYYMIFNIAIPSSYLKLLLFMFLKIVFDYTKCTISYIEVKLRGVKKEEGYVNYIVNEKFRYERFKSFQWKV